MLEVLNRIKFRGESEMELRYKSTRSNSEAVSASQAILPGLAQDGGLYVPEALPKLDRSLEEFYMPALSAIPSY